MWLDILIGVLVGGLPDRRRHRLDLLSETT